MMSLFAAMAGFWLLIAAIIVAPHLGWADARAFGLFCILVGVMCCFMALMLK